MLSLVVLLVTIAFGLLDGSKSEETSFLDFSVPNLQGHEVSMREFHAFPVILVVNVASQCGYTDKNYRELQELYEKYHDEGFMVLGFPCNQFGGQEPGTADDILKFTQEKYHVTFPLFSKVDVNGENAHPLFTYLKKQLDGYITNDIKWNFTKFLIVNHEPFMRYGTSTSPLEIESDIIQALQKSRLVDDSDDGGAADGDYGDTRDEL
ncbi:RxLR-like protein [Plasmopara halstedii]|uniref:Glutathione peroxidase n=1 Tax=Plasmopara halstedii TaxID=4781 RepID=A0A0P1B4P4_PLAHL|nr:RxLR-like protein [Plasmopara halstedii]CEG49095.1 RxLR-like protein [Plasmopara halstedii]|eukprot:XP_024585464.1 RxLR-like protein [Plasmopara halstedii]